MGEFGLFLRYGFAVYEQRRLIVAAGHELITGFDVPGGVGSKGKECQAGQDDDSRDAHARESQCEFCV